MLQTAEKPESNRLTTREERARKANSGLGRVLRYVGLVVGIAIGWNLGIAYRPEEVGADSYGYSLLMSASLGALLFIAMPYITIGLLSWVRAEIRRIEASDLVAVGAGLLIGGLVSTLLAWPISILPAPFGSFLPFLAALVVCTLAVIATITKKHELAALIGVNVTRSDAGVGEDIGTPVQAADSAPTSTPEMLIDTSAIIDGRIAGLVEAGFFNFRLVVPQFVLHELQLVADSGDHQKRTRGQRGLQVLERLKQASVDRFEIREIEASGDDVDSQLVATARTSGAPILSGDTNLERVASLQGLSVLNLHTLAEIMRPSLSTGDTLDLKIVQAGREYRQGVGFLDDGTMVVVDEGEGYIGKTATIVITRTLQTNTGRMMFARLADSDGRD